MTDTYLLKMKGIKSFMTTALVGFTGFVGSNIFEKGKIDAAYNSKNISEAFGTSPDLLIYAGLRAEKYLANNAPDEDMKLIREAEDNIVKIAPKKLVLISTIDVFKDPRNVDESSAIDTEGLTAYGYNRYQLELWVRENYPDALIIRLPGLFGKNIKKNFIYDYINVIPFMLKEEKFSELAQKDPELKEYYELQNNGFYKVNVSAENRPILKNKFKSLGFSALNFTDSRSVYQFYDLDRLWDDIQTALNLGIKLWHPATEPVSAGELYEYLTGEKFVNELGGVPADYNYKTVYSEAFGGKDGYISNKGSIMELIQSFINSYRE